MESSRFDSLTRGLAARSPRRAVLGLVTGLGLGVALLAETEEKKKKKGKPFCLDGRNVSAKNKKQKKKLRKKGATVGKCCVPDCDGVRCGGDDGCGGTCGCGAGTVCAAGTCETCTVTCTGNAATCGAALQTALNGGGNVYACPGLYAVPAVTGFRVAVPGTSLYGAGSGDDQASDTILDAEGGGDYPVINSNEPSPVSLSGLRITGNNNTIGPGGIFAFGDLTVEKCAIVDNTGGTAGGIAVSASLTMSNSQVSGNTGTAANGPGGILLAPDASVLPSTITNSVIDGNTGNTVGGVSFITKNALQTLTVDNASQITNNTANGTVTAGGIAHSGPGSANATGATVTGNTDQQCSDVTGC